MESALFSPQRDNFETRTMKEFAKFFKRRYSAVHTDDEQQLAAAGHVVTLAEQTAFAEKQRRKSLKTLNRSKNMSPAGILSSFFNERQSNKRARSPKCAFLLLTIGILAITAAVLVKIIHPYDMIFKWKLRMSEDGEIFNLWAKPPVDLYIKIYLFNITNAEAFLAGREKMNVEQVGPYVYKEIMTHENVTFNDNNTMTTNPSHPLVWQEHLSEGRREDDQVVMLNIAMLAISHLSADKSYFLRMALNTLFVTSDSQPLVRMTAKEFMFGYPSSLTTLGNTFLPNWISFEKVGLIDRMYDFSSDFETFHTGVPDVGVSGLYATYRGETELPQWEGDHCSNIELASDGTKFRSFLQPNESVKFFRKSMCRPINLYRVGEEETHGSLSGYKYVFEENAFDNGAINEQNKCFCRKGKCQPQGLIDVTDCYYGFPISLSFPHFMNGDPGLQNNITGLAPSKENHSSAFVIQPESGLPLTLSVKVQINMHFNDLRAFSKVSAFSHLTAPMLWFEIMMPNLPSHLDSRFNFYLNILPYVDTLGFWGGLLLGAVLLVYAVTRATLRMSSLLKSNGSNGGNSSVGGAGILSDSIKYGKANLLRAAAQQGVAVHVGGNGVYNPCEMKLLHSNEKQPHIITRDTEFPATVPHLPPAACDEDALIYTAIDMKQQCRRESSFALEMEPAISDSEECSGSSSDEGNDSESATLSRNSTSTSSVDGGSQSDGKETQSYGSSGLASSIGDSTCEDLEANNSRGRRNSSTWSMNNAAASLPHPSSAKTHPIYDV